MISKLIALVLFLSPFFCSGQTFTNDRSSSSITVQDARWRGRLTMYLPHTHGLTLNGGLDTLGAMIYEDSSGHVWYRDTVFGVGHKWTMLPVSFTISANNGLTVSANVVQLGQTAGAVGDPAKLLQKREVPLNAFGIRYWDSLSTSSYGYIQLGDTMHTTASGAVGVQETHQADTVNDGYNWLSFRPKNYLTVYPGARPNGGNTKAMDWTMGYSQNSSGGLPMPDNVFGMGYNILNGVSRKDTGDAALSMRLETSFAVLGAGGSFEMHWPELVRYNGGLQRVNSWYINKETGNTLWENNLDDHQIKSAGTLCPGCVYYDLDSHGGQFPTLSLAGAFNNSLDGDIVFIDKAGASYMLRALDGSLFLAGSSVGASHIFYNNGDVNLNYSANVAQTNGRTYVGNPQGPLSPYNSAQLAVLSLNRGFLPPQMTATQKNAISSPAEGLVVHDLTIVQNAEFTTKWINRGDDIKNHVIFAPTEGGTVSLTNNIYNVVNPAGALTAITVNLPSSPVNNDAVTVKFTQPITTVTYGNGTVLGGLVSPVQGSQVTLVYDLATTSWY